MKSCMDLVRFNLEFLQCVVENPFCVCFYLSVHAPFWWIWWWLMKTTEISTSLLLPCLLPNLALTVAQFPQPQPSAQVHTHTDTIPLYQSCCLQLTLSYWPLLPREWWVFGARLCAQQQIPGGVSVPHLPASLPAEEGPGHPVEHQLLFGGMWHLTLPR